MAQSLFINYFHLIYSVKDRQALINPEWEESLYQHMGGILKNLDCTPYRTNGHWDHVHSLFSLSKRKDMQLVVREVKRLSSRWIRETQQIGNFAWQRGYACFSVSPKDFHSAKQYIDNQKEHHQKLTFQQEVEKFMAGYNISTFSSDHFF
jgi:REP element-mobilizing transposase RayT